MWQRGGAINDVSPFALPTEVYIALGFSRATVLAFVLCVGFIVDLVFSIVLD